MLEVTTDSAADYLRTHGFLPRETPAQCDLLAWGVSNVVLRITPQSGRPFVIKQSREKLRTKADWFSRLDRIYREIAVMRLIHPLLPAGVVPQVLFEDRPNYLFGMEAAPADHHVWKQILLEGRADRDIPARLGIYLATIHRETALRPELAAEFGNHEVFVELRVDPFYRRLAEACPKVSQPIQKLIDEMFQTVVCLVHADFSPKNVLIAGDQLILVDFETGHLGDPAFDLGFFLSHLLLKTVRHASRFHEFAELTNSFWETYLAGVHGLPSKARFAPADIHRRTVGHLAGCMWARIDATSRVDYLDAPQQEAVRTYCRSLFFEPPADWPATIRRLYDILQVHQLV
ncbi:MAG: phosphotransferase [Planctomycetes bacterium]|nr:phosphotransferase [Planctomycetota bacterium]